MNWLLRLLAPDTARLRLENDMLRGALEEIAKHEHWSDVDKKCAACVARSYPARVKR